MRIPAFQASLRPDQISGVASVRRRLACVWTVGGGIVAVFYLAFSRPFPLLKYVSVMLGRGDLTKFDRVAGYTYVGAMLLLAALFALAVYSVAGIPYRLARWPIYTVAVAAGVVLLAMYPGGSIDVFVYAAFARVWVHFDANPLLVPAATFPKDPVAQLAAGWSKIPSPYGPLWTIISAFPELLARANVLTTVLLLKGMALGFHVASIPVVSWILKRFSPRKRSLGTLLFAWNPVILFETVGNGHNDGAMMFFVLAAVALSLAKSERWRLAAPSILALAALVKYTTGMLFPVLYVYHLGRLPGWRARIRFLLLSGLLVGVVVIALFAPFWEGPRTLDAALYQNTLTVTTPVWILNYLVKQSLPSLQSTGFPQKALFALFGLVYIAELVRVGRDYRLWLIVAFEVVFFSLYAVGKFYPWYAVWPLALAALSPDRRRLAWLLPFTLAVLLWDFFMDFDVHWMSGSPAAVFRANVYVVALVFVVPGLVRLFGWLGGRKCLRAAKIVREPAETGGVEETIGRTA